MPLDPAKDEWIAAEVAIRAYGRARQHFYKAQDALEKSKLLSGNDNKVGIAGEFWAKMLFHREGWTLVSVPYSNNEGFDFSCSRRGSAIRVSVKVISDESVKGRQLPLKSGAPWDVLCVLLLKTSLTPYRYGIAKRSQFKLAQRKGIIGCKPTVSRSWLNPKGWISRYGEVKNW